MDTFITFDINKICLHCIFLGTLSDNGNNIRVLIFHKLNIHIYNENILRTAVTKEDINLVKWLLNHEADINKIKDIDLVYSIINNRYKEKWKEILYFLSTFPSLSSFWENVDWKIF